MNKTIKSISILICFIPAALFGLVAIGMMLLSVAFRQASEILMMPCEILASAAEDLL